MTDNNLDKIKSELSEINMFVFEKDARYILEEMTRSIDAGDVIYLEDFLNLADEDMEITNKQNLGWRTTEGMDVEGVINVSTGKNQYYISGLTDKLVNLSEMPVMTKDDPVNHPSHYTSGGGIECIDAIAAALSCHKDPMGAWFTGQIMKYIWRWPLKNGLEDLKKARFYLERLIEHVEEK